MPVDKYILLRSEDYDRLKDEQTGVGVHIDPKTLYHSNQKGLSTEKPSQQISTNSKTSNDRSLITGGGEVGEGDGKLILQGEQTSPPNTSTISKPRYHWFDVWEGLHFTK